MKRFSLSKFAAVLRAFCFTVPALLALSCFINQPLFAQEKPMIPNFWDPQERPLKPDALKLPRLLFLTTTDFPPFSFIGEDTRLLGFHVDLARAICDELNLKAQCQIQALPFDEIESALNKGAAEAALAGIAISRQSRNRLNFSRPYFRLPARFIAQRHKGFKEPLITDLAGKTVAVVEGTAHAAYAQRYFGDMHLRLFSTEEAAMTALTGDKVEAVFSDGLSLAFWMQQPAQLEKPCCGFIGGPYLSQEYFGNGLAVAVAKDNLVLQDAIDFALRSLNDKGVFAELYLRYFPISLY